ncbi:MAG TPA: plastocyanin/azurin family copper-binding protein [Candidatus Micrarchaeia archaeon]|nr:plastocyanin/azurin family copper-binding protein [Candidatus Micrarchaeia archaeon]
MGPKAPARARGGRPWRPLTTVLGTGLLTLALAGCGVFGSVGDPTDAHAPFPPGNVLPHSTAALELKAFPAPLAHPDYTVIVYHSTNTVGEFAPEDLTVPVGSSVQWVWTDHYDLHNVWWIDQNLVNSPTEGSGFRWAVRFLAPGIYDYYCTLHPGMIGRVVVTPSR